MCAGNEAFYALLYVMHFYTGPTGEIFIYFSSRTNFYLLQSKYSDYY